MKKWHSTRPESRIRAQLKRKFGLTLEEWNEMFNAQGGCCAICGKHQSRQQRRMAVDHNHETGQIRALLCQNCNHGLGHFYENVASLSNAISYLQKHTQ